MNTVVEIEKTQVGRLWSIAVFGAAMLYLSGRSTLGANERSFLAIAGVMTIITTGYAYVENQKRLKDAGSSNS